MQCTPLEDNTTRMYDIKIMSAYEMTKWLANMVPITSHNAPMSIFKCPHKDCDYRVRCINLGNQLLFKCIYPRSPHKCSTTSCETNTATCDNSQSICNRNHAQSLLTTKKFIIKKPPLVNATDGRPYRFSNSQLGYISFWCSHKSWKPRSCQIPSPEELMALQKQIGPSPSLNQWFKTQIRKHTIGLQMRVMAWRFDEPNKPRWSKSVYGERDWEEAMCHGEIIGVEVGKGFVAKMRGIQSTASWESLLRPDEIIW